jgi:hypothetical protein
MNEHYTEFKFPQIKAHPWNRVRCYLHMFRRAINLTRATLYHHRFSGHGLLQRPLTWCRGFFSTTQRRVSLRWRPARTPFSTNCETPIPFSLRAGSCPSPASSTLPRPVTNPSPPLASILAL